MSRFGAGDYPLALKNFECNFCCIKYEKTGLRGFRPGRTQTGLGSHGKWLEACNFRSWKNRDCTISVATTKALIGFAVTAKLICVFVFAYAKSWFSHDAAHISVLLTARNFPNFLDRYVWANSADPDQTAARGAI